MVIHGEEENLPLLHVTSYTNTLVCSHRAGDPGRFPTTYATMRHIGELVEGRVTCFVNSANTITFTKMADNDTTKKVTMKKPAAHPPAAEMVTTAITELKDRNGSSLQAIKKYIETNFDVQMDRQLIFIKRALKSGVEKGKLLQTKGKGASGSFKLNMQAAKAQAAEKAKKEKEKAKLLALREKAKAKDAVKKEKAAVAKKAKAAPKKTVKKPAKKTTEKKEKKIKTPKKKATAAKKATPKKATKKTAAKKPKASIPKKPAAKKVAKSK